tara:strand:- start:886 stop:1092 length:207 start_codon:yes stop_codon:yes gene_type:complete
MVINPMGGEEGRGERRNIYPNGGEEGRGERRKKGRTKGTSACGALAARKYPSSCPLLQYATTRDIPAG